MKALMLGMALALTTTGAAAAPDAHSRASVVCLVTPLFLWPQSEARPRVAGSAGNVRLGAAFDVLSGPRATLDGFHLYELDVPASEIGYNKNEHYWIDQDCVSVTK
jgi:hypothetical protein